MTPFCFEHVFRAPTTAAVFAAYFDPQQQREQDKRVEVIERTVLELEDDGDVLRRVSKIVPRRKLPALVRSFAAEPLHYIETIRWRRRDDELDIEIRPSILKGKTLITAVYRLSRVGTGEIRRRYEGAVSVDVALIAKRIERGFVDEFERSLSVAAACTQDWLDRSPVAISATA